MILKRCGKSIRHNLATMAVMLATLATPGHCDEDLKDLNAKIELLYQEGKDAQAQRHSHRRVSFRWTTNQEPTP